MSALDSSLNSISAAFTADFYRRFKPGADEQTCLRAARRLTIGVGVFAILAGFVTAANKDAILSIWNFYMKVFGLCMGCLAGVFMLGIFTRRATAPGAWTGVIVGGTVALYVSFFTPVNAFLYAGVAIIATFAAGYVASLRFHGPERDLAGLTLHARKASAQPETGENS
jgi:Na+/proline symporter